MAFVIFLYFIGINIDAIPQPFSKIFTRHVKSLTCNIVPRLYVYVPFTSFVHVYLAFHSLPNSVSFSLFNSFCRTKKPDIHLQVYLTCFFLHQNQNYLWRQMQLIYDGLLYFIRKSGLLQQTNSPIGPWKCNSAPPHLFKKIITDRRTIRRA